MASIGHEAGGRRRILFVAPDGKRKTIRLGKVTQRAAEAIKTKVEALVVSACTGLPLDDEVARWVASRDSAMVEKLAAVGLVPKRHAAKLGAFLDEYIASRADVKRSTAIVYGHTRRCLVEYFGSDKALHEVTPRDGDRWRLWLVTEELLADNTVRRRCGIAKQFFRAAVRDRLIAENPFRDLVAAVRRNDKRYYFVTQEEAQKVLEACPSVEWRLLFALSRFGGLRCPSEHHGLRWVDVDWERERITIHSPKTEHHEGGATRQIPIFPELRSPLEEMWEEAEPGTEYVFSHRVGWDRSLRTRLWEIIGRAGLTAWPKLWQNLRSTRETELAERFPMHVVCAWIGNSPAVAAKHYLQVTDEHFRQGITETKSAAQNPAQQMAEMACNPMQHKTENPGLSGVCESVQCCTSVQVGDEGLEPPTSTV
jgi:integrase